VNFAVRKISSLDKQTLRTQALAKRKAVDADNAKTASLSLAQNILKYIGEDKRTIAGYAATRSEIDLFPALWLLADKGHILCLPVIEHKESPLTFRYWKPGNKLIKSSYAIDVPETGISLIPDIILTPLLAFDAKGNRLGYGAGYYDRTIAALRTQKKTLQVIGVAYDVQRLDFIPPEPQDEKLDAIITETSIIVP